MKETSSKSVTKRNKVVKSGVTSKKPTRPSSTAKKSVKSGVTSKKPTRPSSKIAVKGGVTSKKPTRPSSTAKKSVKASVTSKKPTRPSSTAKKAVRKENPTNKKNGGKPNKEYRVGYVDGVQKVLSKQDERLQEARETGQHAKLNKWKKFKNLFSPKNREKYKKEKEAARESHQKGMDLLHAQVAPTTNASATNASVTNASVTNASATVAPGKVSFAPSTLHNNSQANTRQTMSPAHFSQQMVERYNPMNQQQQPRIPRLPLPQPMQAIGQTIQVPRTI